MPVGRRPTPSAGPPSSFCWSRRVHCRRATHSRATSVGRHGYSGGRSMTLRASLLGASSSLCSTQKKCHDGRAVGASANGCHRHLQKKRRPKMDHWGLGGDATQPLMNPKAAPPTRTTSATDAAKRTTRTTFLEALTTQCCCSADGLRRLEG